MYTAEEGVRKSWTRGWRDQRGAYGRVGQAAKGEIRRSVATLVVLEIQERNSGVAGESIQNCTPPNIEQPLVGCGLVECSAR